MLIFFHRTSFIHMTTFASRRMNMLCIKIKISTLCVLYNNATRPVTVRVLLFVDAHFRASSKLPGIVWKLTFYSHCRKHLADCIVSQRKDVWVIKLDIPPLSIEIPVPSKTVGDHEYVCVWDIDLASTSLQHRGVLDTTLYVC